MAVVSSPNRSIDTAEESPSNKPTLKERFDGTLTSPSTLTFLCRSGLARGYSTNNPPAAIPLQRHLSDESSGSLRSQPSIRSRPKSASRRSGRMLRWIRRLPHRPRQPLLRHRPKRQNPHHHFQQRPARERQHQRHPPQHRHRRKRRQAARRRPPSPRRRQSHRGHSAIGGNIRAIDRSSSDAPFFVCRRPLLRHRRRNGAQPHRKHE